MADYRAGGVVGLIPAHAGKTLQKQNPQTRARAHPRACGENLGKISPPLSRAGSSPRMRGKLPPFQIETTAVRLIPAHAGKTLLSSFRSSVTAAHPRACGENLIVALEAGVPTGSSPRMRGKRHERLRGKRRPRLIPAHAGKTERRTGYQRGRRAHPRACGENYIGIEPIFKAPGSSPRMRGKRDTSFLLPAVKGLIPAHAGKTSLAKVNTSDKRAHPRACGENGGCGCVRRRRWGSSPRMRGKQPKAALDAACSRLIPAHAGKTGECVPVGFAETAHPRACGENRDTQSNGGTVQGSSPRMRGKPSQLNFDTRRARLIPAHAGKTFRRFLIMVCERAHPRACGENHYP